MNIKYRSDYIIIILYMYYVLHLLKYYYNYIILGSKAELFIIQLNFNCSNTLYFFI